MDNSKKILKNTFFLYGKSALTIFITMYSTRVLLSSLGAEDYGIFSIIFGFVSFVAFFQIAMSSASQRFISIFLGQNDLQNLNKVFNTTVLFHLIVAVVLCFILELIGLLFFEQLLNIPTAKMETAKIVYQFVVLVTFIKVNAVPYDAVIRANEDMGFIAILGILETILTLVIAFLISVLDNQKLIYYSFSYTLMVLLLRLLISFFSFKRYRYLSVKKEFLFQVYKAKDIFNYAKWNLFGSITALTKSQGLNYILNLFLGPVANSAYSISNQLNNQTIFFSRTIESTIKPQLFKTYGNNEKEKSKYYALLMTRASFALTSIFAIPLIYYLDEFLKFWLGIPPNYTKDIMVFFLIGIMSNQLSIGLDNLIHANGNIKFYMILSSILKISIIPISILLFSFSFSVKLVFVVFALIEFFNGILRVISLNKMGLYTLKEYLFFLIKSFSPVVICSLFFYFFSFELKVDHWTIFFNSLISVCLYVVSFFIFCIDNNEKLFIKKKYSNLTKKLTW